MKKNIKSIIQEVYGDLGFSISTLTSLDLLILRKLVKKQYTDVLKNKGNVNRNDFLTKEIDEYHTFSDNLNHEVLWPKKNRILYESDFIELSNLSLFKDLKMEIGELFISDEENIGYPEIYWRLVRPLPYKDVGPLHADAWFWNLGHGITPISHERIKFWIALYNETGENGFCFVPGSHKRDYDYKSESRHGFIKPIFNPENYDLDIQTFNSSPGDFIVFNDKLLHGGKVGGTKTRVSIEFTLFISKKYLDQIEIKF